MNIPFPIQSEFLENFESEIDDTAEELEDELSDEEILQLIEENKEILEKAYERVKEARKQFLIEVDDYTGEEGVEEEDA